MKSEPDYFDIRGDTPFGRSVTKAEFTEMWQTGRLQGAALERYWRMNDFQQPMPAYLELQIKKSDLDRLIRELKRRKGKRGDRSLR